MSLLEFKSYELKKRNYGWWNCYGKIFFILLFFFALSFKVNISKDYCEMFLCSSYQNSTRKEKWRILGKCFNEHFSPFEIAACTLAFVSNKRFTFASLVYFYVQRKTSLLPCGCVVTSEDWTPSNNVRSKELPSCCSHA